jgi:L-alanine-DL-glutamate epimerase-like enolase superfamily enzyme
VGTDVDILLQLLPYDMDLDQMIALGEAFSAYHPFWYQGTWPEVADQAVFARSSDVPVASSARGGPTAGRSNWSEMLCAGAMAITNPDLMSVGGLWEMKKIAAMAEAFGVRFSPHSPYGPVHTMADVHLCATVSSFCILEYSIAEAPWRGAITVPGEEIVDGYAVVPDRPGLGIELDEVVARHHPLGPHPSPDGLDAVWGRRGAAAARFAPSPGAPPPKKTGRSGIS